MEIKMGDMGILLLNGRALCAGDIVHVLMDRRWLPVFVKWSDELGWYGRADNDDLRVPLGEGTEARWPNRHFIAV